MNVRAENTEQGRGAALPDHDQRVERPGYVVFFDRLFRAKLPAIGLGIILLIVLMAIFAPYLAPHDPTKITVEDRLKPPVWSEDGDARYLLGTDSLGRDVLSRLIYGARVSLIVGFSAVVISGTIGVLLGLIAGYAGGRVEDFIMRLADIQLAFPYILLAIAVLAVLGPGLVNIIFTLSIAGWPQYGRVVRGQVVSYREREFVEAAEALGASGSRVVFQHILPNIAAPVIVIASFAVAGTIISEASLSFLGLGVQPDVATWGAMLSIGREYVREAWWLSVLPGLAIVATVLGVNVFGDWLRDYLDPKLDAF